MSGWRELVTTTPAIGHGFEATSRTFMATFKITQTRSVIRMPGDQKRTMVALGLRRMHQTVEHEATPQIRGMVTKVHHLVRVEEA